MFGFLCPNSHILQINEMVHFKMVRFFSFLSNILNEGPVSLSSLLYPTVDGSLSLPIRPKKKHCSCVL